MENSDRKKSTSVHVDAARQLRQDGGCYGWVVVLAAHICNFFVLGVLQSIGPLFVALQEDFDASSANTSWLLSLMFLFQLGCGPIANVSTRRYGHRVTVMIGSVISSTGYLLSSYAPSIEVVNVTFGGLVGFGYALIVGPSLGIVALYIKRRFVLANSLVMVGSSIGGIVLAPMFQFLINKYGWRDTLFIFAGMNLQMCICALFFKAPESPGNVSGVTGESSQRCEDDSDNKKESSKLRAMVERLDLDLFIKHKQFTVFAIAIFLGLGLGLFGSIPHWYARADDLQLAPLQELAFLVSIFGISGLIGRLLPNLMRRRNSIYVFGFTFIFAGVTNVVSAFAETYASYAVYVGVLGLLNGVLATLMTQVPRDIVGPQKITVAIGLSNPFMAVGAAIGPTTAGLIYDQTGDYDYAFYFYGACSLAAGILVVVTDPFIRPLYRRQSLLDLERGSLPERKSLVGSDGNRRRSEYGSQEHNRKDTQT